MKWTRNCESRSIFLKQSFVGEGSRNGMLGRENFMERTQEKRRMAVPIFVVLISMYIMTFALLLLSAFLLYKGMFSEKAVSVMIQIIYVLSGFFGGFFCGKLAGSRKYLWGLLMGALYFGILLFVGFLMNGGFSDDPIHILTTMLICIFSSVAGGMVS